ncbi:MAG: CHAD domain-containing protein [Terriglobia bacterium]|jgi:CHAD domain-containing protein
MDDELTQSHTPTAVEPAPPSLPAAPDGALLQSFEESCKKVRELALRQLNRLMSYEAKVLKGDDTEAIHDMRVASRRLQQELDVLYPKPRPQELRRLRRQIRRCRQVLGDVRNCDVLLEIVGRSLGRKRSARREAWTAVQHFLLMRRSESFLRAMRRVGKINLAVFYVNLKEFLHHDKAHDQSAEHHYHGAGAPDAAFLKYLTSALASAWSRFEDQVAESHRQSRPEVIHGARIATKRLRYLVEVFREFGVAGSADALVWLRQLQNHLGDWHDLEVLEQMMIEMLARPEFLREHLSLAMQVEKLILRNRENKMGFEEKYSRMSRESVEMRRLKEWVAYVLASPSAALAKG